MLPITSLEGFARIRTAITELRETTRAARAARAEQRDLAALLSDYTTSAADRAEMDAILGRYEESPTHRAWDAIGARV